MNINFVSKYKLIAGLIVFVFASVIVVLAIFKESAKTDEMVDSKITVTKTIIKPDFVPDTEKYGVKEEIGGLNEEAVRNQQKEDRKKQAIDKENRAKGKHTYGEEGPTEEQGKKEAADPKKPGQDKPKASSFGTLGVTKQKSVLPPRFSKPENVCHEFAKPEMYSLVSNDSEVSGLKDMSWWTVNNKTDRSVSIIIIQGQKPVLVAFIPPNESLSSRLPGQSLTLNMKHDTNSCVNWAGGYSSFSKLPTVKASVPGNPYKNAMFETTIEQKNNQIYPKTLFLGHTD